MCDVLLVGCGEDVITDLGATGYRLSIQATQTGQGIQWQNPPHLLLIDAQVGKEHILEMIKGVQGNSRVIVLADRFDSDLFLFVISCGGNDYWLKPISCTELSRALQKCEKIPVVEPHWVNLPDDDQVADRMVIGTSRNMVNAMRIAGLVARGDTTILIRGESGTGKELLARHIHELSGRNGPFIALNCAAISEGIAESELFGHERGAFTGAVAQRVGCFEQACGGTLFLDEVGDSSLAFQAKLLRVLEQGEFTRVGGNQYVQADVRVIAATNQELEPMIDQGTFRLDLFYRLGALTINLPALRERKDDMGEIIGAMIGHLNTQRAQPLRGLSRDAWEQILAYKWPGNLRELHHVLRGAALLSRNDVIEVEDLQGVGNRKGFGVETAIPTLGEIERRHIAHILEITEGNRGRACQLLGISRPTLRRKLKRYVHQNAPDTIVPA